MYFAKLPLPLSLVVVVGWPVPKGGGSPGVVVVNRSRPIKPPEKVPCFWYFDMSAAEGPEGSVHTRELADAAMGMVGKLLTMSPILTATGTWHPVTPLGTMKKTWSTPTQQPERPR